MHTWDCSRHLTPDPDTILKSGPMTHDALTHLMTKTRAELLAALTLYTAHISAVIVCHAGFDRVDLLLSASMAHFVAVGIAALILGTTSMKAHKDFTAA